LFGDLGIIPWVNWGILIARRMIDIVIYTTGAAINKFFDPLAESGFQNISGGAHHNWA